MTTSDHLTVSYIVKPPIPAGTNPKTLQFFKSSTMTSASSKDNKHDEENHGNTETTATIDQQVGHFENISEEEKFYRTAAIVRTVVFVDEQNCNPLVEIDEKDKESVHFVLRDESQNGGGRTVATCRVFEYEPDHWKLGRMAVLKEYRGRGLGLKLMKVAQNYIRDHTTGVSLSLNAQKDKRGFYEKSGCVHDPSAGEWLEEGMVHVKMTMKIERENKIL